MPTLRFENKKLFIQWVADFKAGNVEHAVTGSDCRSWIGSGNYCRFAGVVAAFRVIFLTRFVRSCVQSLSRDALAVAPHKIEVQAHSFLWSDQGIRVLCRIGFLAHVGARGARINTVDADGARLPQLVGKYLHQAFNRKLADGVTAPVGPALATNAG